MSGTYVPAALRPVLREIDSRREELFADPGARIIPLAGEERRYSSLLRARVLAGDATKIGSAIFIKVLKSEATSIRVDKLRRRLLGEFEMTARVYEAVAHRRDLYGIRPMACFPELLAVVTEQAAGRTLLEHLQRDATWWSKRQKVRALEEACASVGRWLQMFQALEPQGGALTVDDLCEYVDVRLRALAAEPSIPFGESERRDILAHLTRLATAISSSDVREVVIHGDLAPANILVDGGRIAVLDFAMTRRGSHLHDVARLIVQLELLHAKPWLRPSVIVSLQGAVLQAFDPELSPRHAMLRLLLVLHRVNHMAGLLTRREGVPDRWYSRRVLRQHRNRLAEEMREAVP